MYSMKKRLPFNGRINSEILNSKSKVKEVSGNLLPIGSGCV